MPCPLLYLIQKYRAFYIRLLQCLPLRWKFNQQTLNPEENCSPASARDNKHVTMLLWKCILFKEPSHSPGGFEVEFVGIQETIQVVLWGRTGSFTESDVLLREYLALDGFQGFLWGNIHVKVTTVRTLVPTIYRCLQA